MDLRLKKLDWYIIKKFMLTFFISLLLIIGLVIIFDVSEKIDDFISNNASLHDIVFYYYVNFVPYFINMFSPLFIFITVIFFTSRMAANSEIIAILSGGVSYHRMMVPYLISALFIALLSLMLNLYVVPKANKTRLEFEATYVKSDNSYKRNDIHYQIAPGMFVYVKSFSSWNNTAYQMTIESLEGNKLVSKLTAETAAWDSASSSWKLRNYVLREYSRGMSDRVTLGPALDTALALTVSDFYRNNKTVQTLTSPELAKLISVQKLRGDGSIIYAQIEQHNRLVLPFSTIILTIMGVCLSSRKRRGGIGWSLVAGIALTFSYILFLRFSQMFVFTGTLSPGVALWLPNVLYAFITALLYKLAPK